jgi:hypothetical protein
MLASCSGSDPASEAPVALMAGQYKISLTGDAKGMSGLLPARKFGEEAEDSICIREGYDEGNVASLAKQYLAFGENCSHTAGERVGNAVKGTLSCPIQYAPASAGTFDTNYSGTLAAESITLEGSMDFQIPDEAIAAADPATQAELRQGVEALKDVVLTVKAERTGDCS